MDEITRNHQRRHNHWREQTPRCKHCGNFVTKPEPENGRVQYVCNSCGRAALEYVVTRQSSHS